MYTGRYLSEAWDAFACWCPMAQATRDHCSGQPLVLRITLLHRLVHMPTLLNHLELGCPNPECSWILFKWKGTSMLMCCIKHKRELSERNHTVIDTCPIFSILKQLA